MLNGKCRGDRGVGRHVPPPAEDLPAFMDRFEQGYASERLTKPRQAIAAAAAHHRLLWIHPFLDGNGRVTRLMSPRDVVGPALDLLFGLSLGVSLDAPPTTSVC